MRKKAVKLSVEQIEEIPTLLETFSQREIGEKFGISHSAIARWIRIFRERGRAVPMRKPGPRPKL